MIKRETVCLIYYDQGKCLSTLFLLHEGMSLEVFLLIPTLSLSQEMAASHLIPEPGGTRSGPECGALSKLCHFLVSLRNASPVPAAVSSKALPLSCNSGHGAADQREQSSTSCPWPRLADWKSSL